MPLLRLSVNGFRNLRPQELDVPAATVLVVGPNGAGKTSLLEAVTVLGNLQSFRPGPSVSLVQHGAPGFQLAGLIERGGTTVELRQEGRLARTVARRLHRGARRLGAAEYLELFPVSVLSSHDRQLIWGGPDGRRRYIDRVAFFLHAETLPVLQRYRRVLRQRNAVLARSETDGAAEAFEHELALLGSRLVGLRLEALAALETALPEELTGLGWRLSRPNLRYDAPDGLASADTAGMTGWLRAQLARTRGRDRARGATAIGPHRHDLAISVAGAPARETLSAGQGKLLATAFRLAAMAVFEKARGRIPAVVFDDVDAELDGAVLERVLARLGRAGQALLSSAHEEMVLPRLPGAAVWRVCDGLVELPAGGRS